MNNSSADTLFLRSAPAGEMPEQGLLAAFVGICLLAVSAASLSLGVAAADLPATPLSGHWQPRTSHGGAAPMQAMLGVAGCGEAAAAGRSIDAEAESMPVDAVMALLQKT